MRIRELRAHLEGFDDANEVFLKIDLDFLDGQPELLAGFKVAYDGEDVLLVASVRRGDLAPEVGWQDEMSNPCDGCPLDDADSWYFEHTDIDTLLEQFCDRPAKRHKCCFLPKPPDDEDDWADSGTDNAEEGELPF